MTSRRLFLAVVALLLLAPTLAASGTSPPSGAGEVLLGERSLFHYATTTDEASRNTTVAAGSPFVLVFAVTKGNLSNNVTVTIKLDSDALGVNGSIVTIVMPREEVPLSDTHRFGKVELVAPSNASGLTPYTFNATVARDGDNGTVILATAEGSGAIEILAAPIPLPPGTVFPWLPTSLVALVVVGGALGIVLRQRAIKRRMNEGPKRSVVMRELELEKKLEKAKDPEQVQEIKQEIRAAEHVREKRRELQILEAKRADALKTIDLLKKRQEAGALTQHQFDNMAAKKRADLAKIEADIAEMEQADRGSAAA